MFSITVYVPMAQIILLYQKEEKARVDFGIITNLSKDAVIIDDYGHELLLNPGMFAGAMLEDLNKSQLGHVDYGLHHARTQAKAQQAAARDPAIAAAQAAMRQGPAVLQPGMNGIMR